MQQGAPDIKLDPRLTFMMKNVVDDHSYNVMNTVGCDENSSKFLPKIKNAEMI
jgi:hypothetical protein